MHGGPHGLGQLRAPGPGCLLASVALGPDHLVNPEAATIIARVQGQQEEALVRAQHQRGLRHGEGEGGDGLLQLAAPDQLVEARGGVLGVVAEDEDSSRVPGVGQHHARLLILAQLDRGLAAGGRDLVPAALEPADLVLVLPRGFGLEGGHDGEGALGRVRGHAEAEGPVHALWRHLHPGRGGGQLDLGTSPLGPQLPTDNMIIIIIIL